MGPLAVTARGHEGEGQGREGRPGRDLAPAPAPSPARREEHGAQQERQEVDRPGGQGQVARGGERAVRQVADEADGHRLHGVGLGREAPAPQHGPVGMSAAIRAREQEGGGQEEREGPRQERRGAPAEERRQGEALPARLLEGEDGEGREPPGEDELGPEPEEEGEPGPGGPRGGGHPPRRGEGAARGGEGEEEQQGGEPDRALVHQEGHESHREDEARGQDRGGAYPEEPRGESRPQEEEGGALQADGHRVGEELPERVERDDGHAPDVGVGAQGQGLGGEGQAQVEVTAAVADLRQLPRQGRARAAEGVVVDELVHVVGNDAGREPGGGQQQGRSGGEGQRPGDPHGWR